MPYSAKVWLKLPYTRFAVTICLQSTQRMPMACHLLPPPAEVALIIHQQQASKPRRGKSGKRKELSGWEDVSSYISLSSELFPQGVERKRTTNRDWAKKEHQNICMSLKRMLEINRSYILTLQHTLWPTSTSAHIKHVRNRMCWGVYIHSKDGGSV